MEREAKRNAIDQSTTRGIDEALTRLTGLSPSSVVVSGHDVGHIGSATSSSWALTG